MCGALSFIREVFAMAGKWVNAGSSLTCTMGDAPAALTVVVPTITVQGSPAANVMDCAPIINIPTFGTCKSPFNPMVAAATAAALGVLTPMPCIPFTMPWIPGAMRVLVRNFPALDNASKCMCGYGGQISAVTTDVMVDVG